MLNFLRHSNFLSNRVVTGVELNIGKQTVYSYCQVKNYYGSISIKKQGESITSLEELDKQIGKNKSIPFSANPPICIVLTGKPVLIKQVDAPEDEDDNIILQKALPGARPDQFYIQKFWNKNNWIIAVVKRSVLDEILKDFAKIGLNCIEVLLGPITTFSLVDENNKLVLPNYEVSNHNGSYSIVPAQNDVGRTLEIEGETINFQSILSFSAGLNYFSKNSNLEQLFAPVLEKTNQEVKFHVYQVALLRLFFVLVLFIAITNYFLSKSYQDAFYELQAVTSSQQANYMLYEQKQSELNQRINILKTTGVSSYNNYSSYADQIAWLTPNSISLLELNIGLIENKIKSGEKLKIAKNQIYIKGIAQQSIELKEFILKLENEDWVKESTIQNYNQTDRENPGLFEIKIALNE